MTLVQFEKHVQDQLGSAGKNILVLHYLLFCCNFLYTLFASFCIFVVVQLFLQHFCYIFVTLYHFLFHYCCFCGVLDRFCLNFIHSMLFCCVALHLLCIFCHCVSHCFFPFSLRFFSLFILLDQFWGAFCDYVGYLNNCRVCLQAHTERQFEVAPWPL